MKKLLAVLLLLATTKVMGQLSFGFSYKYMFEGVEVETVFKNGPADKAGIKPGDLILSVNDSILRMVKNERMGQIFLNAPVTSKFQLGYIGEDEEVYRGKTVSITKEDRITFLNKCLEGNCINGTGKHIDMEGSVYEGNFKNGKRNGKGKCTAANSLVYDGEWKDGKRDGIGKAVYKVKGYDFGGRNWSYEGSWKKDSIDGNGTYMFGDGSYYTGEVHDNNRVGKGRMVLKDSTAYEGQWKGNALNGEGTISFKNGDKHTGTFVNSKLEGPVTIFTKATNVTTTREYKNGKPIN
ncbi:MAG: PDZ domain-containing protein [Bacteroidota bacterium]